MVDKLMRVERPKRAKRMHHASRVGRAKMPHLHRASGSTHQALAKHAVHAHKVKL